MGILCIAVGPSFGLLSPLIINVFYSPILDDEEWSECSTEESSDEMEYQTGRNDINMEKPKRRITFNKKVKFIKEEEDEENNIIVKTVTLIKKCR